MNEKRIAMIGVPIDYGQSRRGVDMGPSAIRYAGVKERLENLSYTVTDLGNVSTPNRHDQQEHTTNNLKNLLQVIDINESVAKMVDNEIEKGSFPLVFGGDHSLSIGTIAGIAKHYQRLGVIWYDAHGDLNTDQTSPSGNIHGMPLAASLGFGHNTLTHLYGYAPKVKPENVVIIGARDLDPGEKDFIRKHNLKVFTMHEIDRLGVPQVIEETIAYLKERTDGVHLSLDLDGLDPTEAPGVGTPVIGGLTYRESHLAMEMLAEAKLITSAEFVEVNPILDEKNKTASLAVGLIGSLFGETLK